MVLYFEDVSEGSESYCRDSFSSCSEHIDVWSESGSDLEEEIFEEQSKNVIFAFEAIGCLGDTDISRSLRNTKFFVGTSSTRDPFSLPRASQSVYLANPPLCLVTASNFSVTASNFPVTTSVARLISNCLSLLYYFSGDFINFVFIHVNLVCHSSSVYSMVS